MLEQIFEDDLLGDPNDLEDIVEQQAEEIEDDPEAQGAEADDNDNAENENAEAGGTQVEPKKKRIVRNPQPKLNPERLQGPRGIAILENSFKDFKFYGKGYERVDLNRVMKRMEHWAHRLYPRFQFDDCLEKIEKLGQKKQVQVFVKKIRMGLETGEEPVILHEDEDDENDQNNQLLSDYAPQVDPFDQLLDEQLSQVQPSQPSTPVTPHTAMSLTSSNQSRPPELTAEQRERMLRNRLLAEERRLARMKEKHDQEESIQNVLTSVSSTSVANLSDNNGSYPASNVLNQEQPPSPSSAPGVSNTVFKNQDLVSELDSSHTSIISSSAIIEETTSTSLLQSVENFAEISASNNNIESKKLLSSVSAENIELPHNPVDVEQNQHLLVMPPGNEQIDCTSTLSQDNTDLQANQFHPILNNEKNEFETSKSTYHGQNNFSEIPVINKKNQLEAVTDEVEEIKSTSELSQEEQSNNESERTEHITSTTISIDIDQNNLATTFFDSNQGNSYTLINEPNTLASDPVCNIQKNFIPMSVDGDQNISQFSLPNENKNNDTKDQNSLFLSEVKDQNKTATTSFHDQNNSNSMLVDNEQDNVPNLVSMLVDNNESTHMSVDAEQISPTSMSVDNEQSNSIPMSVDNDQSNPPPLLLESEQYNYLYASEEEQNIHNDEEENIISNVLQENDNAILDFSADI